MDREALSDVEGRGESTPLLLDQPSAGTNLFVASVASDELPPPYQVALYGNTPKVSCRVCQNLIDISGKRDQHVVKCGSCNEATPIRNAPPGKKYVRCPCRCLLICKTSSQRIACPRTNCKRIINLTPSPVTPPLPNVPGMSRVTCFFCSESFLFNMHNNALARCPHCRKVSSVGPEFAKRRGNIFLISAIIFLVLGITVTLVTYLYASANGGYFVAYIGPFIIGLILLSRSIYYYTMKASTIEVPRS